MVHEFCMLIGEGASRTVAPLGAGTLIDVEFSYMYSPVIAPIEPEIAPPADAPPFHMDEDGHLTDIPELLPDGPPRLPRPFTAWELLDSHCIALQINGFEVLPHGFPVRWLVSEHPLRNDIRYRRALSLSCNGEGASIEVKSTSAIPILARFRYTDERSEFLEIPTLYHVYAYAAGGGPPDTLHRITAGAYEYPTPFRMGVSATDSLAIRPFLHESFHAGVLGVVADYSATQRGIEGGDPLPHPGLLDGLLVGIRSGFGHVSVPFGLIRPGMSTSMERALYRFPRAEPQELEIRAEVPTGMAPLLSYTFGVVERRSSRNPI